MDFKFLIGLGSDWFKNNYLKPLGMLRGHTCPHGQLFSICTNVLHYCVTWSLHMMCFKRSREHLQTRKLNLCPWGTAYNPKLTLFLWKNEFPHLMRLEPFCPAFQAIYVTTEPTQTAWKVAGHTIFKSYSVSQFTSSKRKRVN